MLISEFIERTGFRPTEDYYHTEIEPDYKCSNLYKDDWCKQWKKEGGIQKAYDAMCKQAANDYAQVLTLQGKVKELEENNGKLIDECNQLNAAKGRLEDLEEEKIELVVFLIEQAEKYGSTELREKAIEMMGEREYIAYKINHEMTLWQLDKILILDLLNQ